MVKLQYRDGTLSAYPVLPGLTLVCGAVGIDLKGSGAPSATAAYGNAMLLDVTTGRHVEPVTRKECDTVAKSYKPGPLYISTSY
jgi:hypothetical protein